MRAAFQLVDHLPVPEPEGGFDADGQSIESTGVFTRLLRDGHLVRFARKGGAVGEADGHGSAGHAVVLFLFAVQRERIGGGGRLFAAGDGGLLRARFRHHVDRGRGAVRVVDAARGTEQLAAVQNRIVLLQVFPRGGLFIDG